MLTTPAVPSSCLTPRRKSGDAVSRRQGAPVGVLVHDSVGARRPGLVEAVAAAAGLAVSNVRLQAEVRARVVELAASRRRIVEAADAERGCLERDLRESGARRLAGVATSGSQTRARVPTKPPRSASRRGREGAREDARAELQDFGQGIHPSALAEWPNGGALPALAARAGIPVMLSVSVDRLPPEVEAAVYFVCSRHSRTLQSTQRRRV